VNSDAKALQVVTWLIRHYEYVVLEKSGSSTNEQRPTRYGRISAYAAGLLLERLVSDKHDIAELLTSPQPRAMETARFVLDGRGMDSRPTIVSEFNDAVSDPAAQPARAEARVYAKDHGVTMEHALLVIEAGRKYLYGRAQRVIDVLKTHVRTAQDGHVLAFGHGAIWGMVALVVLAFIRGCEPERLHVEDLDGGVLDNCEAMKVVWGSNGQGLVWPISMEMFRLPPEVKALRNVFKD